MCWEIFTRLLGVSIDTEPDAKDKAIKLGKLDISNIELFQNKKSSKSEKDASFDMSITRASINKEILKSI